MIQFPKTPDTYIQFWKKLAEQHVDIAHTDEQKQFCIISKSSEPFGSKWDLNELIDGMHTKIQMMYADKKYCFALVNQDTENAPTPGTQNIRQFGGGFLILTKMREDELEEKLNAFNDTFIIGEEFMNWFADYLNRCRGQWQGFKYGTEQVIEGDGTVGTAFIFEFSMRTGISFDSNRFNSYTPATS